VVALGNELDALHVQVETNSLTARVRKRLSDSHQRIDELNGFIDAVNCQTIRDRIIELDAKGSTTARNTREVRAVVARLTAERAEMKAQLARCCRAADDAAGERILLAKKVSRGFGYQKDPPWMIRKEILTLKEDIIELERVEERAQEFEQSLELGRRPPVNLPSRKRVPLIPVQKGKL
jgi:hypothetical protein